MVLYQFVIDVDNTVVTILRKGLNDRYFHLYSAIKCLLYGVQRGRKSAKRQKKSAPELARLSEKYFLVKISLYLQ